MEENINYAQECIGAFAKRMNEKALELGLKNSTFNDPCGIDNSASAKDMLKCLLKGQSFEVLRSVWGKETYSVNIEGENPRQRPIVSTVLKNDDSHILTDFYNVLGGKTGTLILPGAYNLAFIAQIPDSKDLFACVVMHAQQPNGFPNNRFKAAKQTLDAGTERYKNRECAVDADSVCAAAAIVYLIPEENRFNPVFDEKYILFEKNADEVKVPASMSKILTTIVCMDLIEDLNEKFTVSQQELEIMPKKFYHGDLKPGDVVAVLDLFHAMMLPSSNSSAFVVGYNVGKKLLNEK